MEGSLAPVLAQDDVTHILARDDAAHINEDLSHDIVPLHVLADASAIEASQGTKAAIDAFLTLVCTALS
jgi:hypothetical protein